MHSQMCNFPNHFSLCKQAWNIKKPFARFGMPELIQILGEMRGLHFQLASALNALELNFVAV